MTTPLKGDLKMNKESVIDLLAVGDLILDEPAPMAPYFASSKPVLQSADLLIGHVETPHTDRGVASSIDLQAPPSRPEHLDVLKEMGFHIATLAGNHIYDCGTPGVVDTYDKLTSLGIIPQGAGANIHVAKEPAIVERAGVRIGVISFNAVGPKFSWATSQKAGCAYLNVLTHYEQRQATPGGTYPPAMYTFVDPISQMEMKRDIEALKSQCDIAVVALHKGAAGAMGALEMYERPLAWAAVDAGADIVLSHHAHMCRGIEVYKGKPIYHGLGNFVCVTYALTPGYHDTEEKIRWTEIRRKAGTLRENVPPYQPWAQEAKNIMIARVKIVNREIAHFGFIPCYVDEHGSPIIKNRENGGQSVMDYVAEISDRQDLGTKFAWSEDGSWVYALPKDTEREKCSATLNIKSNDCC